MIKTVFVASLLGLIIAATAIYRPSIECYSECENNFHLCRKTTDIAERICCSNFKFCFQQQCTFETFFCPPSPTDFTEGDDVWGMLDAFNREGN